MTLLTAAELKELTGTPQRRRQKAVLDRRGIGYLERLDGSICTTWEAVNRALTGDSSITHDNDVKLDLSWCQHGSQKTQHP